MLSNVFILILLFIQIAVKRLKVWSNKADMEFAVEVEILARVRHKNLLSLRGYCAEGQERLIVYDYMPNLSLLSHLHGQHSTESLLDWNRRMNIAIGSAEGIVWVLSRLSILTYASVDFVNTKNITRFQISSRPSNTAYHP